MLSQVISPQICNNSLVNELHSFQKNLLSQITSPVSFPHDLNSLWKRELSNLQVSLKFEFKTLLSEVNIHWVTEWIHLYKSLLQSYTFTSYFLSELINPKVLNVGLSLKYHLYYHINNSTFALISFLKKQLRKTRWSDILVNICMNNT